MSHIDFCFSTICIKCIFFVSPDNFPISMFLEKGKKPAYPNKTIASMGLTYKLHVAVALDWDQIQDPNAER